MRHVDRQIRDDDDQILTSDVLCDVLGRVNAETLARVSCVSAQFRSVGSEEAFWEKLGNERWSSTKELPVKTLVASVGGFRKLYSNCFPFVLCNRVDSARQENNSVFQDAEASSSDFVSIIDVTYTGESVLSRIVDGIPGAGAMCGPLVDILEATTLEGHGVSIQKEEDEGAVVTIHTKIPRVSSVAQERKDGRFWAALCNQIRVSWILINKKTQQMVNLASWKPLGGVRHRPCSDDFLLRFGSILPSATSPVHCNITMRCRTCTAMPTSAYEELQAENPPLTIVKVTELGMHLEDVHGVHLRASEAIAILSQSMICEKTISESKILTDYHNFISTQISNQESLIRRECHRQAAGAVFFVSVFVIVMSILV